MKWFVVRNQINYNYFDDDLKFLFAEKGILQK